ncbi:inositol monophosphatase [Micrococcales bacterium 31B]|nr:inositol monophosphatase [Micrococcales bacterium 31B]
MNPDLLTEIYDLALTVARRAGVLILDRRAGTITVANTKSTATDVVTAVDRESEDLIRSLLMEARPDDAILGEEGDDHAGTSGVTWVVDPIDGTVNFLYGVPAFAVSIAAKMGDQTIVGAVFDPTRDEMFAAAAGRGATLNGAPIRVSECSSLAQALVGTGFGYDSGRRAVQASILAGVLPRVRDVRRGGCASLDLCYVACGRLDAEYERGLNPWDFEAGLLIAQEAGASVTGLFGAQVSPEFCVTAGPGVFGELTELLESLDPVRG